jgi:hypothetical protein
VVSTLISIVYTMVVIVPWYALLGLPCGTRGGVAVLARRAPQCISDPSRRRAMTR